MSQSASKRFYWAIMFLLCSFAVVGGIFLAQRSVETALAVDPKQSDKLFELRQVGTAFTGGSTSEPVPIQLTIVRVVKLLLGMVGTVFLIIILYGGYLWFSAGGNEDQVTKAKKTLIRSIIGMILISASYAIVTFIFRESVLQRQGGFDISGVPGELLQEALP